MQRISAIVITKNEARNIIACLDSLRFCDEVIVVDSGSTDDTISLAERAGARVVFNPWSGYGPQKNFALSLATGDWVLSVDADERVSPALAVEVEQATASVDKDGFEMPRLSTFCGREMWHSGWYPDYVLRLFRRGRARFSDVIVHERVVCQGMVGRLATPLTHHPVIRLEDALSRMDRYSTSNAEILTNSRQQVWFIEGILHGLWSFLRSYVLRAGFCDGREGFLLAVAIAEGSYYRYMKAWVLQYARRRAGDQHNDAI